MPDITRRGFILTAAAASSAILLGSALTGCGSTGANSPGAAKRLTVAASPTPHAKILSEFAAPKLKDQGIELTVKEYTDYIIPNQVTSSGEVDANYFQHINYLAGTSSDLLSIADGAQIAVPNDPTNEGRALLLLQQEKIIRLSNPNDLEATATSVADNPHNVRLVEVEAAAVPRQLQDVNFAVINGNYAIEAGMHASDALAVESAQGVAVQQYANYIVTTPDKKDDERIAALVKVLTSDDFKKYLSDTYGKDVLSV